MRYAAFCILLLAISEPLLIDAKKLVVVVPRQIRRSPGMPWRSGAVHYKKSSHNDVHRHAYHSHAPTHYHPRRPTYRPPPFPHGGDDFDQGHEHVNHVNIPYGKDISHAITFGKGYVPYDSVKGSFTLGHERNLGMQGHRHSEPEYAPTSFTSMGSEFSGSLSHHHESPHSESLFFSSPDSSSNYRDRKKYYTARSIEKDLGVKAHVDFNSPLDTNKEQFSKQNELFSVKDVLPQQGQGLQGAIVLPLGIPAATIGGNKDGIVLRDTVALEEYSKRLDELTKSWPALLTGGAANQGNLGSLQEPAYSNARFPTGGLQVTGSGFTGSTGWLTDFAQPKQGYAVKEDVMEPSHDFRSMPVQTTPYQQLQFGANVGIANAIQTVHG